MLAVLSGAVLVGCDSSPLPAETRGAGRTSLPAAGETDAAPPSTTGANAPPAATSDLLWESPTDGGPVELAYLPPAVQGVVACRPAELLAAPEGKATLAGWGELAQRPIAILESQLGLPCSEVETLLVGLLDGEFTEAGLGPPRLALVATIRHGLDVSALRAKWGSPESREHDGETYYEGSELAWYLPRARQAKCLVVAPREVMPEILELNGRPPSLRQELSRLLAESDRDRQLTVAVTPSFLATGGKQLLTGPWAPLTNELAWWLDDQVLAVLGSLHLERDLFLEARFSTKADVRSALWERAFRTRLGASEKRLEEYLARGVSTPYGAEILARFPQMWQQLVRHARTAHHDREVIVRAYLPGVAAHNLALATRLALTEIVPRTAVSTGGDSPGALSLAARLQRPISLVFPRQTLEQALELFGREAGIDLEIRGADLQLEGITKNQSFGLEARNLPALEVLEQILRLASPEGKLVHVIETAQPSGEKLFITTRAAAAKRRPAEKTPESSPPEN
ncbi:MAG: hypothetical protein JNG90_11035 [Planctomycetaceae bacterium]|nr:hypothetical protein [Planctomycetaceae bacterium]